MNILLAVLIAVSWLAPNHYPPWTSFHNEAAACAALLATSFYLLVISRLELRVNAFSYWIIALIGYCLVQYLSIKNIYLTQAIFGLSYLALFLLALTISVSQPIRSRTTVLLDLYAAGILLAGAISVLLQIAGWLRLLENAGIYQIYTMGLTGSRPYANLGQPNNLATLLIWGILAVYYFFSKKQFGVFVATLLAGLLCLGIALTQSRAAIVSLTALTILSALVYSRSEKKSHFLLLAISLTTVTGLRETIPYLSDLLLLEDSSVYERELTAGGIRLILWKGLIDATMIHPFFGWGLREIHPAVFSVTFDSKLGVPFGQSHNLILDLILWFGYPVAITLLLYAIRSFLKFMLRKSFSYSDLFSILCLSTLVTHGMFEYPHHYLYFLIPSAIFLGFLCNNSSTQIDKLKSFNISRTLSGITISISLFAFLYISHGYITIENQFRTLRFEAIGVGRNHAAAYHDSVVFDQFSEFIKTTRAAITSNDDFKIENIDLFLRTIYSSPTPTNIRGLITLYENSGDPEMAKYWRTRACLISAADCNF